MRLKSRTAPLCWRLATSEDDAYDVAEQKRREIESDALDADIHVCRQITHEKRLPDDWAGDHLPYEDSDEPQGKVIQFYLDSAPPEVVGDENTIDMFAEGVPK